MVRKLVLAAVILAMAAVPVPALARDGHEGGMSSEAATSGSSTMGVSSTSTGPSTGSIIPIRTIRTHTMVLRTTLLRTTLLLGR